MEGSIIVRQGSYRQTGAGTFMRITWPCKDGFVNFQLSGGASSGVSVNNFVRWMADEGMADDYMLSLDFKNLGYGAVTMEMMDRIVPPVSRFLLERTKQQLFEGAIERRILLFPVSTLGDILEDPQLEAREFFRTVESPELDAKRTVLGPFARVNNTPLKAGGAAPTLGQHNVEIYVDELGLGHNDLIRLTSAGVI